MDIVHLKCLHKSTWPTKISPHKALALKPIKKKIDSTKPAKHSTKFHEPRLEMRPPVTMKMGRSSCHSRYLVY